MIFITDSANEYIRDALAHLIAAIVACPPNSNHLWYNLFKPEELKDTLLPGFMVSD